MCLIAVRAFREQFVPDVWGSSSHDELALFSKQKMKSFLNQSAVFPLGHSLMVLVGSHVGEIHRVEIACELAGASYFHGQNSD